MEYGVGVNELEKALICSSMVQVHSQSQETTQYEQTYRTTGLVGRVLLNREYIQSVSRSC